MKIVSKSHPKRPQHNWLPILLVVFFLLRVSSWTATELWYDEVLSLQLFVLRHNSIAALFRDYCIANNHFLANAIEWLWVRICPIAPGSEIALRVPALLCGIGTILTVFFWWEKWLGKKLAFGTGMLLAASPVFAAFAFQMRGYSLAMLLSALAVTAMLRRIEKSTGKNFAALLLCSLALPLVMPSAAMLPAAIIAAFGLNALFIGEHSAETLKGRLARSIRQALPAGIGVLLGVLYYATLWTDFQRARAESGGWESSWLVAGHLLLAFTIHLALFAWPLAKNAFSHNSGDPLARHLFWSAAIAAAAVLLLPSPVGRAPFPRVFLPLLPMLTLSAALSAKSSGWITAMPLKKLAIMAALPGLIFGICADLLTAHQLERRDTPPQNLIQQYYRGNSPCSLNMDALTKNNDRRLILVNASDVPAFSFYWQIAGGSPMPDALGMPPFVPGNIPSPVVQAACNMHYELVIFARTEAEARDILHSQGLPENAELLPNQCPGHRTIFRLMQ